MPKPKGIKNKTLPDLIDAALRHQGQVMSQAEMMRAFGYSEKTTPQDSLILRCGLARRCSLGWLIGLTSDGIRERGE